MKYQYKHGHYSALHFILRFAVPVPLDSPFALLRNTSPAKVDRIWLWVNKKRSPYTPYSIFYLFKGAIRGFMNKGSTF